jgi:hypothetical protein
VVLDVAPEARAIAFGALLGGQGQLWINDLSLEVVDGSVPTTQAQPEPERATPRNLDFSEGELTAQGTPPGWERFSDQAHHYQMALERDGADGRKRVVTIQSTTPVGSKYYMLTQTIDASAFHGKRLRLRGRMRTNALLRQAGLFMRVDGGHGEVVAYDNMRERPVKGTTPWQEYQVVLDIPAGSRAIAVGGWLTGGGGISLADLRLDVVDRTIPVTHETPRAPRNLDFRQ